MVIGCLVAPQLQGLDSAFQFIQKYTGFVSPGIFAIFFLGFFWKGATGKGALVAAILALPVSVAFDQFGGGMPFFHAMGYSFLILVSRHYRRKFDGSRKQRQSKRFGN